MLQSMTTRIMMFVVFGRPGAGKSTVSQAAVQLLGDGDGSNVCIGKLNNVDEFLYIYLDLDVCVPQWMKDNFAKGMYPTLAERFEFISTACDYVSDKISINQSGNKPLVPIISFSFVNTDMRVEFRKRFPHSEWILVDTSKDLAEERILSREDHFYKGSGGSSTDDTKTDGEDDPTTKTTESSDTADVDNSEWEFKPVDYPHVILDGNDEVATNAQKVVDVIQDQLLNNSS
mmetsp:Transcript_30085/g.60451  ORF Transcript_30085/g.60451 Transcript_30085/m.60451 type:complete len:231 (+) Transcript_30085:22-714(+)